MTQKICNRRNPYYLYGDTLLMKYFIELDPTHHGNEKLD